jgi:hypothetical protein
MTQESPLNKRQEIYLKAIYAEVRVAERHEGMSRMLLTDGSYVAFIAVTCYYLCNGLTITVVNQSPKKPSLI